MRIDTQLTVWCSTVLVSQSQIACLGFPWEPRILDYQQYLPKSGGHFKSIQICHLKRGRAGGFGYPPFWDSHIVPFSTSYLWDSILSCIQYWYQLISCVLFWAMLQYIWDTSRAPASVSIPEFSALRKWSDPGRRSEAAMWSTCFGGRLGPLGASWAMIVSCCIMLVYPCVSIFPAKHWGAKKLLYQ